MENCNPMEVLFQRRCANFIYVTPPGLRELMSDISREVIRCQPEVLCPFIADYLDALLITRENARAACKIVNDVEQSSIVISQVLNRLGISARKATKAAKVIQRAFRQHMLCKLQAETPDDFDSAQLLHKLLHQFNISEIKATEAAEIIQRAYRGYRARMEALPPCGVVDWRLAAKRTIGVLRGLKETDSDLNKAATLIKAAYKGYYTRTYLRKMIHHKEKNENPSDKCDTLDSEEHEAQVIDYDKIMREIQHRAAIVIQRAFRAYRIKCYLKQDQELQRELTALVELNKLENK